MTTVTTQESTAQETGIRFSLKLLLLATFAFSCWLTILKFYPHIAIFGMSLLLAVYSLLVINYYVHQKRHWTIVLVSLVISLLLWGFFYVLSIGPAAWIHYPAGRTTQSIIEAAYTPVIMMVEANGSLEEYARLYVGLWLGRVL